MPRPNIRPWRDLTELLTVRQLLYPNKEFEHDVRYDSQRLGVNMVNTWKRRCRVPHSIYSTAVLIDASLHHNVEKNSTFAIRAVYSTAFARFVTGFCDMGQSSVVKRSMFEMAELIGMPEAWVELRHEITHGQIPDLRTLEQYVQASLVWLYDFFWLKLDAPRPDIAHEPTVKAEIRDTLKSFLRNRRNEIKAGKTGRSDVAESAAESSKQLLRLVKKSETNANILISVLLERKMLLPSQKQIDMNMKGASLIWDPLLQTLSLGKHSFYSTLTNTLLAEIVQRAATDLTFDTLKSAKCKWLVHLVTSKQWKQIMSNSQLDMQTQIAETSLLDPSTWGHKLVKAIIDRADDEFRELWGPLYEAVIFEGSEDVDESSTDDPSADDAPYSDEERHVDEDIDMGGESTKQSGRRHDIRSTALTDISNMKAKSQSQPKSSDGSSDRGWKLWEGGWVPRPIGV